MFSAFDPALLHALVEEVEKLERSFLEGMEPNEFDPTDVLDGHTFFSIQGLADFWSAHPSIDFAQHITDLVIGAHNQVRTGLTIVLAGTPQKLSVYVSLGDEATTKTLLQGLLPGIQLDAIVVTDLVRYVRPHFYTKGIITGIPSHKTSKGDTTKPNCEPRYRGIATDDGQGELDTQGVVQLERVIRGMHGATWIYVVQAHPRPRKKVAEERLLRIDQLADVISQSRRQLQESAQKTEVNTQTFGGEVINYRAEYLIQLLERELERLDQAVAAGQWLVRTYFGANTPNDARRLASLLVGTLAGKDSRPDPLRAHLCRSKGDDLSLFDTLLSSEELSALIQLPREEVPGYAIHDFVRFDVDFRPPKHTTLALGHIQQNGRDIHDTYSITLNDLAKHGVVVGVTGSGKTTTIMNLLDQALDAGKPFMVIEPAKTEYRALRQVFSGRTNLRVYTLGNEMVAPFRLNPFEFETDDEPGRASILNHIDFLKAVFNAAFILYAPMPYVLETALHEVYEDKGWDLASGLNRRLPKWADRHLYPIFPTLTDLYRKVDIVTDRLGYDREVERNVKAGLKARIGSMRLGSKGLMLDTARGIPMQQLLSFPTVLEMENIGGDEEKTFLMGLLLAKLYEYRRLQAAAGKQLGGLQHLIIFEEAHRLLKNTETQVDTESSNMRAQAVEVFTNMLSEVRAYGQGVIVAEQIPSKLAPDVLKNTNLKIVHRLIAQDDRESVGQTMNLNTNQMTHLGVLSPGMAAVYAEGADHAYLVRMEDYKRRLPALSDSDLKKASPTYISLERNLAILDVEQYGIRRTALGGLDTSVYQAAGKLLETEQSHWLWASILIRTIFSPARLLDMLTKLAQQVAAEMPDILPPQEDSLLRMTIIRGCAETLNERGADFGWTYLMVEEMRMPLTRGLITLFRTKDLSLASSDLDRFARKYDDRLKRKQGPFAGCVHCRAQCVYRSDVRHLLQPGDRRWVDGDLKNPSYKTEADRYNAISRKVKGIAERWLGEASLISTNIGYCAGLHMAAQLGHTEYEQALFGDRLARSLLK